MIPGKEASKRNEKGFASLSEVGQRASHRSSFDSSNYGFARLSDLVVSLLQIVSEKREGGIVFTKCVRCIRHVCVNARQQSLP